MRIRPFAAASFLLLAATALLAQSASGHAAVVPLNSTTSEPVRAAGWPNGSQFDRLGQIGEGVAVVFSPDLAQPGNRRFYEHLGFAYFENPSWTTVLEQLRQHSISRPIEFVLLETHGTNGNGLRLQAGKNRRDARSYISVGALQEALAGIGARWCYVSACNAGRLLRPEIYKTLNPNVDDPLFLPATLGILDASVDYDPLASPVQILRRRQSNLETLIHGDSSELDQAVQSLLGAQPGEPPFTFVVSTMLIQLLLDDPQIELTSIGYEQDKSRADIPKKESERLFQLFLEFLSTVGAREIAGKRTELRAHPRERTRSR